jgi:hypothetical protein
MTKTSLLPLLPMQARSLSNVGYNLDARFFSWLTLNDPEIDPQLFVRCVNQLISETESLRAAFVEHDGYVMQQVLDNDNVRVDLETVNLMTPSTRISCAKMISEKAHLIDNRTGRNLAVVLVTCPGQENEILFMANHFFMDFYSVAWVVAQVFDIYKEQLGGGQQIRPVKTSYSELCHWLDAKQRDTATAKRVLQAMDRSKPAIAVPPMFPSVGQRNANSDSAKEVTHVFSESAHTTFNSLVVALKTTPYWLGLGLLAYLNSRQVHSKTTLHLNIKESGRTLFPINTVGLPSFLAATSHITVPLIHNLSFPEYFSQLKNVFAGRNRLGESSSNFAGQHQEEQVANDYAQLPRPMLLYNAVNLHAFSESPSTDLSSGIYRSDSYVKTESIEVRFLFESTRTILNCSTTKDINISNDVKHFNHALEVLLKELSSENFQNTATTQRALAG